MVDAIKHRGPDDSGVWHDGQGYSCFGHCRLAIVDLSPCGAQPMEGQDGRAALVFNGEIYNYIELRRELEGIGYTFRGHSDTEVLLNGLSHWGVEAALERLVGMFAFAYWDGRQRTLHLARDRVGKKPLYYLIDGGRLYFASEIKAIRTALGSDLKLNHASLWHYLSLGFVPGPATIYERLLEVEPGSHLQVDSQLRVRSGRYWRMPVAAGRGVSWKEAAQEVEERLSDAVRLRLRADVPVAVFLSGGIDSGLITAFAARQLSHPIKTFTIGIGQADFDEAAMASEVARRYGTEHHEIRLDADVRQLIELAADVYDQPFGDPSAIPSLLIAREAARQTKVVLNGEGSDELFGGYRRHVAARLFQIGALLPGGAPSLWLAKLSSLAPSPNRFRTGYSFAYRFLNGVHPDPFVRYLRWSGDGLREEQKHWLFRDGSRETPSTEAYLAQRFASLGSMAPLDHFMTIDFLLRMSECLLVKVDRATMAFGLEARSPFLDHRLVEWAARLRRSDLFGWTQTKPVLRLLAQRYLPKHIAQAPKRGFELPLFTWVGEQLYEMVHDVCLSSGGILMEMCDPARLRAFIERQVKLDRERWSKQVWLLLMLAMWDYRLKRRPAEKPS
jgi:asparagine synthase (glutamine-hydrolysing)